MMHPSESELSLFAGGDLGLLERWRIARHLHRCDSCDASVRSFKDMAGVLAGGLDEMPAGLNWDRLAREMTGNIRVGLAAGECVGEAVTRRDNHGWRAAAVVCSATLLLFVAWFLNIPHKPVQEDAIALRKTDVGIQLKQGGGAMTLLNSRASSPVISSSSPGQLRSRYVDDETNQVTINNVYAQ
jgi:hypothetical protein